MLYVNIFDFISKKMVVLGIVFVALRLFVLVCSIALHIKDVCLGQTRTTCALRSHCPFVLRSIKHEEQVKVDRLSSLWPSHRSSCSTNVPTLPICPQVIRSISYFSILRDHLSWNDFFCLVEIERAQGLSVFENDNKQTNKHKNKMQYNTIQ